MRAARTMRSENLTVESIIHGNARLDGGCRAGIDIVQPTLADQPQSIGYYFHQPKTYLTGNARRQNLKYKGATYRILSCKQ